MGVCRGCGAYTQARNGKGDAYAYCKRCHPGAIERKCTRELVIAAMLEWRERYGRLPSSYDWSRTHARRCGEQALRRLEEGHWPAASVVSELEREAELLRRRWRLPPAPRRRPCGRRENGPRHRKEVKLVRTAFSYQYRSQYNGASRRPRHT